MADKPIDKKEIEELRRLIKLLEIDISALEFENLIKSGAAARDYLKSLRKEAEGLTSDISSAAVAFKSIVGEIRKTDAGLNQAGKSFNKLASIAEKVQYHQREISKLSLKEVENLKKQAGQESVKLENALDLLKQQQTVSKSRLENVQKEIQTLKDKNTWDEQDLKRVLKLESLQNKIQKTLETNENTQNEISGTIKGQNAAYNQLVSTLDRINNELEEEKKTLGLTGALLTGISKIPILGNVVDTQKALDAAKDYVKEAGSGATKIGAMKAAFKNIGGQIKTSLTDPLVIVGFLVKQFIDALSSTDKLTGELAKDFNMTYREASNLREELIEIGNLSGNNALNARALQESMVAVGKSLGSNAKLNKEDLVTFTELREMAGYTNEELVGIQKLTLATGGSLKNNTKQFLGTVAALNAQNKLTVNEKQLLKEVANTSAAIKLSVGGTTEGLAKAAFQAKQFGINLDQADRIAESLLDFESSITNELSAELITGKDLNLERARLLALNGKSAEASAEILKQVKGSAEFTKMNRIQQEALAKAVGMSREDLAASLVEREALAKIGQGETKAIDAYNRLKKEGLSDEQIAAKLGDGQLANQLKQQSIQERLNNSIEKMKELFVGVAQSLMPMFDTLSAVLDIVGYILKPLGAMLSWAGSISPYLKTVLGLITAIGVAAMFSASAATLGMAAGTILVGAALGNAYLNSKAQEAQKTGDLYSPADGKTQVSTKEGGLFELSKNDSLFAFPESKIKPSDNDTAITKTNLDEKEIYSLNKPSTTNVIPSIDFSPLINEFKALKQEITKMSTNPTILKVDGAEIARTTSNHVVERIRQTAVKTQ